MVYVLNILIYFVHIKKGCPINVNSKFITHNSSGYDTDFVFNYILRKGHTYQDIVLT